LAIAIIPPFALWGVFMGRGEKSSFLGTIENSKISVKQYLDSYKAVQHQAMFLYGPQFESIKSIINFKGEAWDRLLLLDYAKKEKIRASDQEVVDWLAGQPVFARHGYFDMDFYKRYVTSALRTSTRDFEEEIRQILVISKIRERLRSQIHFTDEELKNIYEKAHQPFDEKKFSEEKESFRQTMTDEKIAKEMRALLEKLRGSLKVDLETMKQIFGAEEKEVKATEPQVS